MSYIIPLQQKTREYMITAKLSERVFSTKVEKGFLHGVALF